MKYTAFVREWEHVIYFKYEATDVHVLQIHVYLCEWLQQSLSELRLFEFK